MNRIVTQFPQPPGDVLRALELLEILGRGDPDEVAAAGDLSDLPRPWEPSTCEDDLRESLWQWCDRVAIWLNHEYAWRPTQMIPPCWPHHPHIARELPLLALLRWSAEQATTPQQIEEWHRSAFPTFCDRMLNRLGESGCRIGKHIDWPAAGRYATYTANVATNDRHRVIFADTRPAAE